MIHSIEAVAITMHKANSCIAYLFRSVFLCSHQHSCMCTGIHHLHRWRHSCTGHCDTRWCLQTHSVSIYHCTQFQLITRSTQRAQTSLAEADHYSHIAHCKNVEPWLWKTTHPPKKKKKKGSGSLPAPRSGCATTITLFFAHLLILQYPDHHQNLISSSLYYSGPVQKFHPNPFITFWVMLSTDKQTNRQTDRQTDRQTN